MTFPQNTTTVDDLVDYNSPPDGDATKHSFTRDSFNILWTHVSRTGFSGRMRNHTAGRMGPGLQNNRT